MGRNSVVYIYYFFVICTLSDIHCLKTWMISNLRCHIYFHFIFTYKMLLVFHTLFLDMPCLIYYIFTYLYHKRKYVYFELMCHNNGKFDWSLLAFFLQTITYIIIVIII